MQTPYGNHEKGPHRNIRKSQISPQRQWLVGEMQSLNSGWIKHLVVANHQPLSSPAPKKRPRRKLTGPRQRPMELPTGDFMLKEPVLNLFDYIDELGDGTIMIEVSNGLPVDVTIE